MNLLNILLSPVKWYKYVKLKEQTFMLCWCCVYKEIEEPTVWDVDILHKVVNEMLAILHDDPHMLDKFKIRREMFWHLLLSKWRQLEISRTDVQHFVSTYAMLKDSMQGAWDKKHGEKKQIAPTDLFVVWKLVMKQIILER